MLCALPDCSKVASKTCSRCRITQYCDAPCQKAHWSSHKEFCSKIKADTEAHSLEIGKGAKPRGIIALPNKDWRDMMLSLSRDEPYYLKDKVGCKTHVFLSGKTEPYEKSTSRRVLSMKDIEQQIGENNVDESQLSFCMKLQRAYGSSIWHEEHFFLYSVHVRHIDDPSMEPEHFILLYNGKNATMMLLEYTQTGDTIECTFENKKVTLDAKKVMDVKCEKPFDEKPFHFC